MNCQRRTDTVCGCPEIGWAEVARQQWHHQRRVQNAKSSIDQRRPAPQPHLTLYGRDNIAKKKAVTERTFSDIKMVQSIAQIKTRRPQSAGNKSRANPPSSISMRKQEMLRIWQENHQLLDRLEKSKPTVCTRDLLDAHKKHRQLVINASHATRLSGGYDDEIAEIHRMERSATLRKSRSTVSVPTCATTGDGQSKEQPQGLRPGTCAGVGIRSRVGRPQSAPCRRQRTASETNKIGGGAVVTQETMRDSSHIVFPNVNDFEMNLHRDATISQARPAPGQPNTRDSGAGLGNMNLPEGPPQSFGPQTTGSQDSQKDGTDHSGGLLEEKDDETSDNGDEYSKEDFHDDEDEYSKDFTAKSSASYSKYSPSYSESARSKSGSHLDSSVLNSSFSDNSVKARLD